MQLPEKYKEKFDVSSEGQTSDLSLFPCIFQVEVVASLLTKVLLTMFGTLTSTDSDYNAVVFVLPPASRNFFKSEITPFFFLALVPKTYLPVSSQIAPLCMGFAPVVWCWDWHLANQFVLETLHTLSVP
jgi:hypothetical protein